MIRYATIAAPKDLQPFVRFYWTLEGDEAYTHHSMACGSAEMVFHYHGIFSESDDAGQLSACALTGLQGPSQHHRRFSTACSFGILGVYLYPFAIPVFFDQPAYSVSNQMPDLGSVMGATGEKLEEQVLSAADNRERIRLLNTFFRNRLKNVAASDVPIITCITQLQQQPLLQPISQLAADCYLSSRQFERRFKMLSGFSPKLYSRICRFEYATRHYAPQLPSLSGLALDCGYFDQSHFIHDFKAFSGLHPRRFFNGGTAATLWRD